MNPLPRPINKIGLSSPTIYKTLLDSLLPCNLPAASIALVISKDKLALMLTDSAA